jgi:hypothetical protein
MRSKFALALTSAVVLTGASAGVGSSSAAAPGSAGAAAAVRTHTSVPAHRAVLLPTGDRVAVTTDAAGRMLSSVARPRPGSSPFQSLRVGPHLYVIPHSAAPKIGHTLNVSQFDVTAATTPVVTPKFPMVTLTVHGIDAGGGRAADTAVTVVNVDDNRKFFGVQGFVKGVAKFSVPNGHYLATTLFRVSNPHGPATVHMVTVPQFTVSGASSVTMDARTATSLISVETPRPAAVQGSEVVVGRADATGSTFGNILNAGTDSVYVSPTKWVTVGQLFYSVTWRLAAPDGSYTYDVKLASDGAIAAQQRYTVTVAQLATITSRYHSEVPRPGLETRFSFLPWQTFGFATLFDLPQPGQRTEYVMANPDIGWQQLVVAVHVPFFTGGTLMGPDRIFTPGQRVTEDWNRQPMHPGVQADLGTNFRNVFRCPSCRVGDAFGPQILAFADNTLGHVGSPFDGLTESATLTLSENGHPVTPHPVTGLFPLTPAKASYRLVADTVREAPYFTLSTKVHTEWGFTSSHAGGSGTLPPGWLCPDFTTTDCGVVPLMMARYDLPVSLSGTMPAGATRFDVTVDHVQGGPALPVSSAQVSVSYVDGATWLPATVTGLGGGQFRVAYTTPAAGATNGYVGIRLAATDAAGGTLSQTIVRAYAVK